MTIIYHAASFEIFMRRCVQRVAAAQQGSTRTPSRASITPVSERRGAVVSHGAACPDTLAASTAAAWQAIGDRITIERACGGLHLMRAALRCATTGPRCGAFATDLGEYRNLVLASACEWGQVVCCKTPSTGPRQKQFQPRQGREECCWLHNDSECWG